MAASGKGTILVVDDEPGLRDMLSILFRRDGYQVMTAAGVITVLLVVAVERILAMRRPLQATRPALALCAILVGISVAVMLAYRTGVMPMEIERFGILGVGLIAAAGEHGGLSVRVAAQQRGEGADHRRTADLPAIMQPTPIGQDRHQAVAADRRVPLLDRRQAARRGQIGHFGERQRG